jgi:hypothetical protein
MSKRTEANSSESDSSSDSSSSEEKPIFSPIEFDRVLRRVGFYGHTFQKILNKKLWTKLSKTLNKVRLFGGMFPNKSEEREFNESVKSMSQDIPPKLAKEFKKMCHKALKKCRKHYLGKD